jgi:hypothetical protein
MLRDLPPRLHRLLVTPEREGEKLSGLGQAFEPLDRDEAVDLRQHWPQPRGDVEVLIAAAIRGPDFKNNGDHAPAPRGRH